MSMYKMFNPKELDSNHRGTGDSSERAWVIEHQHNHQ